MVDWLLDRFRRCPPGARPVCWRDVLGDVYTVRDFFAVYAREFGPSGADDPPRVEHLRWLVLGHVCATLPDDATTAEVHDAVVRNTRERLEAERAGATP